MHWAWHMVSNEFVIMLSYKLLEEFKQIYTFDAFANGNRDEHS